MRIPIMQKRTEEEAYEAGRDCALNGANTTNCHFSLFFSPDLTDAWNRGIRETVFKAEAQPPEGEGR